MIHCLHGGSGKFRRHDFFAEIHFKREYNDGKQLGICPRQKIFAVLPFSSMNKVKLIFGTFNAVPSAETEHLFEDAYQKAFKPFLTAIYNHGEIKSTLFFAGPLLEWLDRRHPEFHTVLGELTAKRAIEILGGGYWEPMLPLIPSRDCVGQIEVMTTYLRKKFGKRSRGGWITGHVWEAHLASALRSSGIDYVFLTERCFPVMPGFRAESPVIAEDQGKTVVIFPVMDSLAERFLQVPPEHILDFMQGLLPSDDREVVVSLLLDGLSLGGNGTHRVCYGERWLERFFEAVRNADDWLECVLPGRYIRGARFPRGKVYVPGPSYDFLMGWTRGGYDGAPPVSPNAPIPGGDRRSRGVERRRPRPYYREFLTKYRESGLLYSKMMHIDVLTNQLRGDKYRKKDAKEELWRGQEHYAYWHGPSGGIYSSRLRHGAYGALIEAEKTARERGIFKAALTSMDFDMDGNKEFLYNGLVFNAYVHSVGGVLFELDYLPISRNYLATFSRYPENYHPPATREQGYDRYPRHAFLDHILHPEDELESFERSGSRCAGLFPSMPYTPVEVIRDQARVSFTCIGPVNGNDDALEIQKTFRFRRGSVAVNYSLVNRTPRTLAFSWGTEINLALADEAENRPVFLDSGEPGDRDAGERGCDEGVEQWTILDVERDVVVHFELTEPAELWRFPVYADYCVGRELRRNYQSSCFMPKWRVEIPPFDSREFSVTLRIGRSKKQG